MPPYTIVLIDPPRPPSRFRAFYFLICSTNTYRTLSRDWHSWTHLWWSSLSTLSPLVTQWGRNSNSPLCPWHCPSCQHILCLTCSSLQSIMQHVIIFLLQTRNLMLKDRLLQFALGFIVHRWQNRYLNLYLSICRAPNSSHMMPVFISPDLPSGHLQRWCIDLVLCVQGLSLMWQVSPEMPGH